MAKLISEDKELKSSFEIKLKELINNEWMSYEIIFNIGSESQTFKASDDKVIGQFVFALRPKDRLEMFLEYLEKFAKDKSRNELVFEPADPSFELILKRAHGGIQAYMWVDHGNTTQLRYTWDARGIRFFTSEENLEQFINQLKSEAKLAV